MRPGSCRPYGGVVTGAVDLPAASTAPMWTGGVWAPQRRRLTLGLVLTITLVGFESLAISTVLPLVTEDLGGLGLYGWVFSGFFLGNLLGIVAAGQLADRRGTALPVRPRARPVHRRPARRRPGAVDGRCSSRPASSRAWAPGPSPRSPTPASARPTRRRCASGVFAVFSSAWVIPGLVGPAAASGIAGALGWRAVFLSLLPFVALSAVITLPSLSRVSADEADAADAVLATDPDAVPDLDRRGLALVLVIGVAAVLVAAGGPPLPVALALAAIGVPTAVWAFLRLVPAGTVRLAPGIPAAIAVKGILTFAFFGTDAYVSLTLKGVRDQATWIAGASLTSATLMWAAASWVQDRYIHRVGPRRLVRIGLVLVAVGTVGELFALGSLPIPMAVPVWGIAGFGIGLAYSPISVVVLGLAAPGREGSASASVQLCDVLGVSLGTGATGAFVALGASQGWATRSALELAFVLTLAVAVLGVLAARRLPTVLPGEPEGKGGRRRAPRSAEALAHHVDEAAARLDGADVAALHPHPGGQQDRAAGGQPRPGREAGGDSQRLVAGQGDEQGSAQEQGSGQATGAPSADGGDADRTGEQGMPPRAAADALGQRGPTEEADRRAVGHPAAGLALGAGAGAERHQHDDDGQDVCLRRVHVGQRQPVPVPGRQHGAAEEHALDPVDDDGARHPEGAHDHQRVRRARRARPPRAGARRSPRSPPR